MMRQRRPAKRGVVLAVLVAAVFSALAALNAVQYALDRPAWHASSAFGYACAALLWAIVALYWNKRAGA